jgi:long-chain acyl-CoA synthetase
LKDERWTSITYGEFLSMAGAAASALKEEGTGRGGRVAIVAENRPEWCAFYLGTLMRGAVAVPVDMRLTPGEIRNILEHSGAGAVVFSGKTARAVKEAVEGLDLKLLDVDSVDLKREGEFSYEETGEDDLASLLYTSGTTGAPKAVMLTHRNLRSDAEAVREVHIIGPGDNVLSALPLHHTYPFMCSFALPLLVGGRITYPKGLKGTDILDAVKSTGVTLVIAVPLMLELMRDRIFNRLGELRGPLGRAALAGVKLLGSLREKFGINPGRHLFARKFGGQFRFFACGGARLEPRVMKDMEALGFTVVEGFGLTETSPIVTRSRMPRSISSIPTKRAWARWP